MRRRIQSSKKNKKIKSVDPFYTGERRQLLDKHADKANSRPIDIEVQEIPRSLQEIITVREQIKTGKFTIRKRKRKAEHAFGVFAEQELLQKGMKMPIKETPIFKKKNKESQSQFISRVGKIAHEVVSKTRMENKYGVDFIQHPGGKLEIRKKKRPEFDEVERRVLGKREPIKKTSQKKLKKKEKEHLKKQKLQEDRANDFSYFKDEVQFGEVVMQPPTLQFNVRKSDNSSSTRKPGKKPLLLKSLLSQEIRQSTLLPSMRQGPSVDLTGSRKGLSVADRRNLDLEREKAIASYRMIKRQRTMKNSL